MKVLLIVVLTLGCTHGATVWNQTDEEVECTLHIQKDILQNMIIMEVNGQVKQPDKGKITVKKNEEITVSCSENINTPTIFECVGLNKFKTLGHQNLGIHDLRCDMNTQPKLKGKCFGTKSLIEIGFKYGNSIVEQIEVCFDDKTKHTLYVKMMMSKLIDDKQSQKFERPAFRADGTFIKESIDNLYEDKSQQATFMKLLGKTLEEKLIAGHLVAFADFPYTQQRLLTTFYLNTAPQWIKVNKGNWNELKQRIRSTRKTNEYDVYIGTYGILELADNNGNDVEMYLSPAGNNKLISKYPVPKYFWKVLIEKTKNSNEKAKGIAFIGSNNIFLEDQTQLCNDVMHEITWLKSYTHWEKFEMGRVIACELDDFKTLWGKKLPDFPPVPGGLPIDNL